MNSRQILILCGITAPVIRQLAIWGFGSVRPDYSQARQIVSELGAQGAPLATLFNLIGLILAGCLTILYASSLYKTYPSSRTTLAAAALLGINGLGSLIAGFIPCDPGCPAENMSPNMQLHILAGVVAMLSGVIAPLIFGTRIFRTHSRDKMAIMSLVFGLMGVLAFIVLSMPWIYYPYGGLVQRIVFIISDLWIFTSAVVAWRKSHRLTNDIVHL